MNHPPEAGSPAPVAHGALVHAFRALVDEATNPLAVLDGRGRFIHANRAFGAWFAPGHDPDDLMDVEWSAFLSEEAAVELRDRILPAALCGGWEGELARRSGAGPTAAFHARLFPVPVADAIALAVLVSEPARVVSRGPTEGAPPRASATPVLPIAERVIVVPVAGALDRERSNRLMRCVLAGIRDHRAKAVIIDVTGLGEIDTQAADYLAKTVLAARLKGARTVVSGVSENASSALTDIEVDWRGITTVGDLRTALIVALRHVGFTLQSSSPTDASRAG
jgi:anti-anti-sigma regulatory factor